MAVCSRDVRLDVMFLIGWLNNRDVHDRNWLQVVGLRYKARKVTSKVNGSSTRSGRMYGSCVGDVD